MPQAWRDLYGSNLNDTTQNHFLPEAYQQGLVWDVMGYASARCETAGFGS